MGGDKIKKSYNGAIFVRSKNAESPPNVPQDNIDSHLNWFKETYNTVHACYVVFNIRYSVADRSYLQEQHFVTHKNNRVVVLQGVSAYIRARLLEGRNFTLVKRVMTIKDKSW